MTSLLVVIFLIFSSSRALEISSKIDLDFNEQRPETSTINSDPLIIVIKNEPVLTKETHDSRPSGSRSHSSGSNFNFRNAGNSRRTWNNYNPLSRTSKTINNIYIVVNGKDIVSSIPDSVDCKDNICETIVTTNTNDEDNETGSVSVKILTEPKSINFPDVPIIDGIRASGYEYYHRDSPTFVTENSQRALPHPHFIDNNIPQEQAPRRNPPRAQSASFHPRNFVPREKPIAWNPWIPGTSPVDDKIEPPLSKTDHDVQ